MNELCALRFESHVFLISVLRRICASFFFSVEDVLSDMLLWFLTVA